LKDRISTWLVNFRLADSNPRRGQDPIKGRIDYNRDPDRFIFNYIFKALMTGIDSTVKK
jgi:hypothetical protein